MHKPTRAERREARKRNRQKMVVTGRSVFILARTGLRVAPTGLAKTRKRKGRKR